MLIDQSDIRAFRDDGAVCLRGLIDLEWIALLREGVDRNIAEPGPYAHHYTEESGGSGGMFFGDYCNWQRIPEYREFALQSPAAGLAAALMDSKKVNFFHEHVLVKEPGTTELTPWHHDQPYWCVDGEHVCSLWIPLDAVPREICVKFVRGSHRWGRWFKPRRFGDKNDYAFPDDWETVPDIDSEAYEILSWDMQPGDCIAFHALTLHGAPGNASASQRRRAFAARWTGDDARFALRPGPLSPPFPEMGVTLRPGDLMDCETFPVVWPRAASQGVPS